MHKLMGLILSYLLIRQIKLLSLVFFLTATTKVASTSSNKTDQLALLSFKDLIAEDPLGSLSSWNNSLNLCRWDGVMCSRKHQRVVVLDLRGKSLRGTISPFLGNLSFLRSIYLQDNRFRGKIPQELGHLFRLQHLNLSSNSLEGEIPNNFSNYLTVIDFKSNNLVGQIPASFGSLSKLTVLELGTNNLIGGIPSSLSNLSILQTLYLGSNSLTGTILNSIGRLTNLRIFRVGVNKLTGTVPPPLYNISTLRTLIISGNQLTGSLPLDIGLTLPNLRTISIAENTLQGPFPPSFSNASSMRILDLSISYLSGPVPFDLGRNMKDLDWLNFGDNNLGSGDASDLRFIDSLTNCTKLRHLDFYANGYRGVLPVSIANFSGQLKMLDAGENQLVGTIPTGISNLVGLFDLNLDQNLFSGVIPFEIGELRNMQQLDFSRNKLSGPIPSSIGNLTQIFQLKLQENNFNGTIPSSIENILDLQILNLSYNLLVGPIPRTISLLSTLYSINLAHNFFTGPLPFEIGNLNNLQELDASSNKLSGHIPSTLGNCLRLESLLLEFNMFQGSIPPSFSSLKGIETLDLSHNNLSGEIPADLAAFVFLNNLNLSFNHLAGEVPSLGIFRNLSIISLVGNTGLCGGIAELQLPACPKSMKKGNRLRIEIIIPTACLILCLSSVALLVVFLRKRRQRNKSHIQSSIGDDFMRVSYDQLSKATNGFLTIDSSYIGEGTDSLAIKGSIGYVAPEYGVGGKISKQGDVYSYGILLLEMLTGRRPTDEMFTDGQSLHEFCKSALPEGVMGIVDPRVLSEEPQNGKIGQAKVRECLISLMTIGVACSAESPGDRMNVRDALMGLTKIKEVFLGVGIHGRR
ncbi:hypothetical protein Vadar_001522 [Vaccinium darrowii]|uniref:Uncharacterized protein n=1 Tax=Vaccinium darrowii TaxID=229202 RepID=A0ACB7XER8_9ERIC|nr:hypothetical protein Vadar_001522 [Vaccinium darrowii]